MKRTVLFLLATILAALPLAQSVSATSPYDTAYSTTDNLTVSHDGYVQDLSTSWFTTINDIPNNRAYGVSGCREMPGKQAAQIAVSDIQNGNPYIVSQHTLTNGDKYVQIWTYENGAAPKLKWNTNSSGSYVTADAANNRGIITIGIDAQGLYTQTGCANVTPQVSFSPFSSGYSDNHWQNFLVVNVNPDYPQGYAGMNVRDTFTPKTGLAPKISYSVEDKKITAKYIGAETCFKALKWTVYSNDHNASSNGQLKPISETFDYEVKSGYGVYTLIADPNDTVPYAPADCGADVDVQAVTVRIEIDGSSFSGDSSQLECESDASGQAQVCVAAPLYEDCSTYGVDVVGGIGCVIKNFGIFLREMLKWLFVPTAHVIKEQFDDLGGLFTEKLGFLATPFTFLTTITTALAGGGQTQCAINFGGPGGWFGGQMRINMCALQQSMPSLWTLLRTILIGVTCLGLFVAFDRKYKEMLTK